MKKMIIDDTSEGLEQFLGERLTFFCINYIYTGILTGVNEADVLLTSASVVYETGAFSDKTWKDAQALPHDVYLRLAAIEAYMKLK